MDILIRYGFSIEEINIMMNCNEEINNIDDEKITDVIQLLEELHCTKEQIKNIIITNPFVFCIETTEIKKIVVKLLDLGIEDLNILFDTNPYLLNSNYKEIESFIRKLKKDCSEQEMLNAIYYQSYNII